LKILEIFSKLSLKSKPCLKGAAMSQNWSNRLRGISTFIRSADARSFSKAALELGITPQAVSAQIKQLEEQIGVGLFRRTTRRISLTEEGARFYERCCVAINAIDEGVQDLQDAAKTVTGTVRISVPYYISRAYILPILTKFLKEYPDVTIELIAQNEYPDVVDQRIDLAILSRHLPGSSFIAREIASVRLILCAAPSYLKQKGGPKTPENLRDHRCVALRHPVDGRTLPWTFQIGKQVVAIDVTGNLVTNDTDTQRQAVLHGFGIGQLASFFVRSHVRDGSLKPLLMNYVAPPIKVYLCMANRLTIPKRTKVLFEFLEKRLSSHPDFRPLTL
jgi:DNA-binding transcriptional LysR family regulator